MNGIAMKISELSIILFENIKKFHIFVARNFYKHKNMKKIFSVIIALVAVVAMASAQTVESSRCFENTYIGVNGGVISPFTSNNGWGNSLRPVVGVEFGKDITPVVGFSVEGIGSINTTGAHTWFDQSNVTGNVKVNLSNWFGGYKGQPRRVEVLAVPGLGWGHNYGETNNNYLTYNANAQVNINLGQARAWQINIKPGVTWATGVSDVAFNGQRAAATVRVGITYKFGSKRTKSHNFVLCPYSVTKADYDAVVAERDALKNRKPETVEVVKEVPVEKVVEKTVEVANPSTVVTFNIGEYTISDKEYALLKAYAANLPQNTKVTVVGSADLGTGSQERNQVLAENRAKVVADALTDLGVYVASTSTAFDTNDNAEASRAAIVEVK